MMRYKVLKTCFLTVSSLMVSMAVQANDLKSIYEQVTVSDPRLQQGTLGITVGESRERQALGSLYPQVSLSSTQSRSRRVIDNFPTQSFPGERYALILQQALYDPVNYRNWQRAKSTTAQFSYEFKDTLSMVRMDTVERYFALLQAMDELALINEEIESITVQKNQTEALFERRLVQITEVLEIQSRLDTLVADKIEAEQIVDIAKANLSELTGQPVESVAVLADDINFAPITTPLDVLLDEALMSNPALLALNAEIEAAGHNVRSQRAKHLPNVSLQVSKQVSDIGFENAQTPETDTETISLNINVPLYSGGTTSAQVSEASAQLSISQSVRDQKRREINKEIQDAYLGINSQLKRIEATKQVVNSSEKAEQARTRSFELGVGTISDVIDAKREVSSAKRAYQQAKYDYILNQSQLYFLVGRLDDVAIDNINAWLEAGVRIDGH